jgi:hypothetical protein
MPTSTTVNARRTAVKACECGGRKWATIAQSKVVAADAHVPGPGFMWPIPKKVAIDDAQPGAPFKKGRELSSIRGRWAAPWSGATRFTSSALFGLDI